MAQICKVLLTCFGSNSYLWMTRITLGYILHESVFASGLETSAGKKNSEKLRSQFGPKETISCHAENVM